MTDGIVDDLTFTSAGLDGAGLIEALHRGPLQGRLALVSSFGVESAVLLHMVAGVDRRFPVIFLDTLKHFPATLAYRDELIRQLGLDDVRSVTPDTRDVGRQDPLGTLWSQDADFCCHVRKTEPLDRALEGFEGWITGRKRYQGGLRTALPTVERDRGKLKINPLANWSAADIVEYRRRHDLPPHPLEQRGYRSIGCAVCTRPVGGEEDARAGRWTGLDKTECGIHLERGAGI